MRRKRPSRRDWDDGYEAFEEHFPPSDRLLEPNDAEGAILWIPDKTWGFEAAGRDRHPGVIVNTRIAPNQVAAHKGVGDQPSGKMRAAMLTVHPSVRNGLGKKTLFELTPRNLRLNRVMDLLRDKNRWCGRLEDELLRQLRRGVCR
jgi:hypothetical protein